MVIYEVNVEVDRECAGDYLEWLRHHVAEMLTLPGFERAALYEIEGDAPAYSVHYHLRDRAALDDYFLEHAERMRGDGMARFAGRFRATRRVLASV